MNRYAVYDRKSRSDDPHEPLEVTLKSHREILEAYMQKNNIIVDQEDYYEEVVSGDSLYSRPEMLKLLEAVENGKYSAVLCLDIQRLGRGSMSDQGVILDTFKYSDTEIITPHKVYNLNNDLDETQTEFETFMGRQELKMIKQRLRRGIKKTIDDGGYIANPPYGYERTHINKIPSLKIVEEEARIVRLMFESYAYKGMGGQAIADLVNSMGAKPRRGAAFSRSTILSILRNHVYIGKIVWDRKSHIRKGSRGNQKHIIIYNPEEKWTILNGLHPAIVTSEIFNEVQTILAGRYHAPYTKGVLMNPIAGLVKCGNCGANMQRQADKKGGPLLLCTKRGCIISSSLQRVENAIIKGIKDRLSELYILAESQETNISDNSEIIASIDAEIKKADKQLKSLHDFLEQGVYDIPTFTSRRGELIRRMDKLKSSKAQYLQEKKIVDYNAMIKIIEHLLDVYPSLDANDKNMLLKGAIESVVYVKKKGAKPDGFTVDVQLRQVVKN